MKFILLTILFFNSYNFFIPIRILNSANYISQLSYGKEADSNSSANSLIIIQDFRTIKHKSKTASPLQIQIISVNPEYQPHPAYLINGVEYCDNGKFNDKVASDGIYTSVLKYRISNYTELPEINFIINDKVKNSKLIENLISQNYLGINKSDIKFSCKIRAITCPETHWWNSCWPFSSPCTCFEFYDCEFEIEIEL